MRLISRYNQLSSAERRMFFRAFAILAIIRMGLRLVPFRVLRSWVDRFRNSPRFGGGLERNQIRQVAWAVEAASRRLPGTTCLPQAMATHLMLGRLGQPSQLQLGVALNPCGALEAHAWVEVGGRVVSGGAIAGFNRFVPLHRQSS
jgi:hypothetical protein